MKQVAVRAGVTIGGAAAALGLGVAAAGPAFADLLPSPPAVLSPVTGLLAPSPSPSPTPSPSPSSLLSPVFAVLPSPVASPVASAVGAVTGTTGTAPVPAAAPAPAAAPKPAAAPAPAAVHPEAATAPQAVAAPRTGFATYPRLATGALNARSGLAPLSSGSVPLPELFPVSNAAQPLALPAAAPQAPAAPAAPLPGGLPMVIVLVAGTALAGTAGAHFAALRARRGAASA